MEADPRPPLWWLPNALTIARCGLALMVGWALLEYGAEARLLADGSNDALLIGSPALAYHALTALITFAAAASTDLVDGLLARRLNAHTAFGAWLDPIADKLLVAAALIGLGYALYWPASLLVPASVIIARDVGVSVLRGLPGGRRSLPVTPLAKWKTAAELAAIALLLAGLALLAVFLSRGMPAPGEPLDSAQLQAAQYISAAGVGLLWIAAALSAITGVAYGKAARQAAEDTLRDTFD
ncbi:MAG: CDP-alcohol phosphatidyltransferase family protein [Pseudomonadota bacterium]